jgi:uncharacterized protein with ParB-like and HNH nuclease domain
MSYHSKSISEIIDDIEFEKAFLPAIQRKFVWPRSKIEKLFDSLMRNFPIGSFLFWELKREKAKEYVFYSFLKDYDDRTPYNIRKEGSFRHEEIIGVLDGQQRLSSLFLGLQGTHRERTKHKKGLSDRTFPKSKLYLNLLSLPYKVTKTGEVEEVRGVNFEFCFLTDYEAGITERKNEKHIIEPVYWFRAGEVLDYKKEPDIDNEFDKLISKATSDVQKQKLIENKRIVRVALTRLHKRTVEPLINYFKVTKDDLDDILEIFIRVNSGATILSKTDLLFSTIVATWEDGRDEIESFLKDLNSKGDGFWFNNDFLMRSCLVLSDLPVLFKVNSFKAENVQLLKDNWEKIKEALIKTVDLLESFGFNGSVLTSQNAIIVIAYHFMKGGDNSEVTKQGIRKYLLYALLKNVYGGQGDQVISSFRTALRKTIIDEETKEKSYQLTQAAFPFDVFLNLKLPANKTLKISEEDIEEFIEYRKGANSFFVLSLLYPNLRFNQVHFHQDHIHPDSRFRDAKLRDYGISEDKWKDWQGIKDTIPNLQLMEGRENSSKNATHFKDWFEGTDSAGKKNVSDPNKFRQDNFIPETGLGFDNFQEFYKQRKELIIAELESVLDLEPKQAVTDK